MRDANGVFVNIDTELVAKGADIAVLIVNGPAGKSCFTGYTGTVGGQALIYQSSDPYAVVADNYLSASADYTGVHEIGHIFNGRHDNSGFIPNRGILNISDQNKKWQSMMGSYGGANSTQCLFTGPIDSVCERTPYFSNPALTFNSDPLGSATRDMETHLESKMPIISNWRGAPAPPPNTPTGVAALTDDCYGIYNIDWNNMNGATSYQLFKSTSPSFTNPTQIYTGTYSNSYVNVTSGTWYFRARACNAGGCSANSSQVSATRLTYCM